jgi:hypothetical protein
MRLKPMPAISGKSWHPNLVWVRKPIKPERSRPRQIIIVKPGREFRWRSTPGAENAGWPTEGGVYRKADMPADNVLWNAPTKSAPKGDSTEDEDEDEDEASNRLEGCSSGAGSSC